MAGRPVTPQPSPRRGEVLERLRSDMARFYATLDREAAQRRSGQHVPQPSGRRSPR